MARIRTVKPEMWSHPKIANVSRDARLTFVGLLNQADDVGRCELIPRLLLGAIFPYDQDVGEDDVLAWISELSREGLVRVYEHRQRRYLHFPGWDEHQRVDKPGKPRCPDPDDDESRPLTCGFGEYRESSTNGSGESSDRSVGAWERGNVGDTPVGGANAPRQSFTQRCEQWIAEQGITLPPADRQLERRKAILGCALDEAGDDVDRARSASMGIICDYIGYLTGSKVGRECRDLISRLVGEFGGSDCLDAAERAMTGGAGLDPRYRDDPLAVGKFMSAVLHGHERQGAA